MKKQKESQSNENDDTTNDDTTKVERTVPITDTEILGLSVRKDKGDDGFILEFGFMKDDSDEVIVIDTRKYLSNEMAKDLYKKLKSIFESDE